MMEEIKKKRTLSKKVFLFGILPLLVIGTAFATGYLVNSFFIQVDSNEPFQDIQYAIIGDADNWDGLTGCDAEGLTWFSAPNGVTLDKDGMFAGEGRGVCYKIVNLGQGDVDYFIESKITNTDELIKSNCTLAFGEHQKSGTVLGLQTLVNGVGIVLDDSAPVVQDCLINVKVNRGTA